MNLIRLTNLMLDTLAKIKLLKSSCDKFNKPVLDPVTGLILKDKEDTQILFVPSSCR